LSRWRWVVGFGAGRSSARTGRPRPGPARAIGPARSGSALSGAPDRAPHSRPDTAGRLRLDHSAEGVWGVWPASKIRMRRGDRSVNGASRGRVQRRLRGRGDRDRGSVGQGVEAAQLLQLVGCVYLDGGRRRLVVRDVNRPIRGGAQVQVRPGRWSSRRTVAAGWRKQNPRPGPPGASQKQLWPSCTPQ
jgi:hypothetical protein